MRTHTGFLIGFHDPINLYTQERDDGWYTFIDPFSVGGDGPTREESIERALETLNVHFLFTVELRRKYGDKVGVFCPLDEEFKKGAEHTVIPVGTQP